MRTLVLDADKQKTVAVVRALGAEHEVWTAAATRPAPAAWSRFARRHLRSPAGPELADWLLAAVSEHAIEAVVATQERTLLTIAGSIAELRARGALPTFPGPEVLANAFDKRRTLELAAAAGVALPETTMPETWAEVEPAAAALGFPLVVKPRHSNFWDGRRFVDSPGPQYARSVDELRRIVAEFDRRLPVPLLQRYFEGVGTGVFLLLDRAGRVAAEFGHQRLRDVRPTGSGSVLRRSVPVDSDLRRQAVALLGAMDWWGVAMVEFRRDRASGEALLMEVNGRFWGSLQLATDAGVNFPRLLLAVAAGERVDPPAYRDGVHLRWLMGDVLRTARVLAGAPASFPGEFPTRRAALADLFGRQPPGTRLELWRAEDPRPALAELLLALRRLG